VGKEVQAEVLLGRVRLHAGMIEFALDRDKRPPFRKFQATTTDIASGATKKSATTASAGAISASAAPRVEAFPVITGCWRWPSPALPRTPLPWGEG